MTNQERLLFCKRCTKREMDLKTGLICSITKEKANFEDQCADFNEDEKVKENELDATEGLATEQIQQSLSPEIFEELKLEQNLMLGIVAAVVVGVVGAILWGVISVTTGYQIGYMAVAIGAAVGFAMRKFGNGLEQTFGIWGAAIAFLSVALGNFLGVMGFFAQSEGLNIVETLINFDYAYLPEVMMATFSFMDVIFYGIALYEGYKFSFRVITDKDIFHLKNKQAA
ncbi:hypothetical protein [Labilibacter marinus]|uniref:hypothetical protein n=1 Tax=Labilibacter marinus TaxID=1477105 RepID=UPI00094FC966|nr:hypothetical protein [Labilibacter marinus]